LEVLDPLLEALDPLSGSSPPERPNLTERVAGWSAGHRKVAVFGWLLLVAVIFVAGQVIGSKNPPGALAGWRET
jgi:hypothetical protein